MIPRRRFLQLLSTSIASASLDIRATPKPAPFKIGACDWCVGQRQHIEAFTVAKKIGLEGLQLSFSTPGSEYDLRDQQVRERYYQRSQETGVRIASLGMGVLNQKPLATHPESINWVQDALTTMIQMRREQPENSPHVCLLAFFGKADINGKPDMIRVVADKLKQVAPRAQDHGIVFGIESLLSADDHLQIIERVNSPAIQVYYDSANSDRMGYNIYEEVVQIGGDRICEVHCKERQTLLGKGKIDFPRFRESLNKAGYRGWLIIEGSKARDAEVIPAYQKNYRYLDEVFRRSSTQ